MSTHETVLDLLDYYPQYTAKQARQALVILQHDPMYKDWYADWLTGDNIRCCLASIIRLEL